MKKKKKFNSMNPAEDFSNKALSLTQPDQRDMALNLFDKANESNPNYAEAYFQKANVPKKNKYFFCFSLSSAYKLA